VTTLEVRNLRKNFGDVAALTDVSLTVKPGEIYGFVGSNGAGKSTTMRIILGVLAADAGEVLWDGNPDMLELTDQANGEKQSYFKQDLNKLREILKP